MLFVFFVGVFISSRMGAIVFSPGKWIKTVLFGKKSSKSSCPKGREKVANEKKVLLEARASKTNVAMTHSFSS